MKLMGKTHLRLSMGCELQGLAGELRCRLSGQRQKNASLSYRAASFLILTCITAASLVPGKDRGCWRYEQNS